ncbi:MAG: HAD-IA family hydrolase [Synechococcales cyanobacterium RM1_1_8]|nr:HAD-IA family hydrolase [Synechococcales cyanobacterium RM1_1_8]
MPLPQALIFDVDGTLADNERHGHRVAFNQAFAAAGLNWHWSESFYGSLLKIGGGKERIAYYLDHHVLPHHVLPHHILHSAESPLPPVLADAGGDRRAIADLIAQLHQSKQQFYQHRLALGDIPLRPGVLRLLQAARAAGLRLAIATTSALPSALALVEQALPPGAVAWFEVIAAGDVVPQKKPAPDIYRYVLDKLELGAADCLVIEDSPVGLQAALAAGLATIVTVNGYTEGAAFNGAKLVLSDLGEPERPFRRSPAPSRYRGSTPGSTLICSAL